MKSIHEWQTLKENIANGFGQSTNPQEVLQIFNSVEQVIKQSILDLKPGLPVSHVQRVVKEMFASNMLKSRLTNGIETALTGLSEF